jgi:hypothetical protein
MDIVDTSWEAPREFEEHLCYSSEYFRLKKDRLLLQYGHGYCLEKLRNELLGIACRCGGDQANIDGICESIQIFDKLRIRCFSEVCMIKEDSAAFGLSSVILMVF